jgi:hypothetical protein
MAKRITSAPYTRHLALINQTHSMLRGAEQAEFEQWKEKSIVKSAIEHLRRFEYVLTIYRKDEPDCIREFYYPCKVHLKGLPAKNFIVNNYDDFSTSNSVILEGTVGQGKSILLRYLHNNELNQAKTIPLFVELKDVKEYGSIIDYLINYIEKTLNFRCSIDLFNSLLEKGFFSFYLDGFDEIEYETRDKYVKFICLLRSKCAHSKVFITARPENEIQRTGEFDIFCITPLANEEQENFIKKLMRKESEKQNRDYLHKNLLNMPQELRDLLKTPLMLTLFSMVYKTTAKIPETYSDFYKKLFDTLVSEHDGLKLGFTRPTKSSLNAENIKAILEQISLSALKNEKISGTKDYFIGLIRMSLKALSFNTSLAEKVLFDLHKNTCLIQLDDHEYKFLHENIPHYFAASCISNQASDEEAKMFYLSSKVSDKWKRWKYVLEFLEDIDERRFIEYFYLPQVESLFVKSKLPGIFEFKPQGLTELLTNLMFVQIKFNDEGTIVKKPSYVVLFNGVTSYIIEKHFSEGAKRNGKVSLGVLINDIKTKILDVNRPDLQRTLSLHSLQSDYPDFKTSMISLNILLPKFDMLGSTMDIINKLDMDKFKSTYQTNYNFMIQKKENASKKMFEV